MIAPYDTYSTAYVHTMWNLNTAKWCGNDMLILELLYALSRERLTSGRRNRRGMASRDGPSIRRLRRLKEGRKG